MAKKSNNSTNNTTNCYKNPPQTLKRHPFYGLILDEEQTKFRDAIYNPEKLIIFADAKAGTGKSTIAVATANLLVTEYGLYDGIVYIVSPTQEQRLGYLPGSVEDKVGPYFEPLYQALLKIDINPDNVVKQASILNQKNGTAYIDALSHVYLRGCNFEKKVVIIDESQNFYREDFKKVLTRIHDSCKVIVIGHSGQIDLYKHPENNGFARYIEWFKDDPRAEVCYLTKNYRGWISTHADELEF